MTVLRLSGIVTLLSCGVFFCGCAADQQTDVVQFPPAPSYTPDHQYTLDELIELSVYRNASLDVARYKAEAAQGLVDQVKALWLPVMRHEFAAVAYANDLNYKTRALDLVSVNIPLTGAYNIVNSLLYAQILSTGGKRTSGLKQAKMFAAIKKLDVWRQQDLVVFSVATFYHLVCLTNEIDAVLEETARRIRVFRQVAENLSQRGSFRANNLNYLQADFVVLELEQLRLAIRAGRHQAYEALKHFVGVGRDEPLMLHSVRLPPPLTFSDVKSVYASIVKGFSGRPELRQVNLFARIREEQVRFAKAAWAPNIAFLGTYTDIQGNKHTILEQVDGLIASVIVDIPLYNPARRGLLRQALGLEQATLAFQRQVEELITLEIEVIAIDSQKTLATLFKAARAKKVGAEQYQASRQALSRDLIPANEVITAIVIDTFAKIQYLQALFAYHNARAQLKRVTADRETQYGY